MLPLHAPFAETVLLMVTDVLLEISAGVYVEPPILPPPETTLIVPFPERDFVAVSHIALVLVVFVAADGAASTVIAAASLLLSQPLTVCEA